MIEIDLNFFNQFATMNPAVVGLVLLFKYYLWIPLLIFIIKFVVLPVWLRSRNIKWGREQKFIYLAIDVPKRNEQSISAMENVFTQILGSCAGPNLKEKWLEGVFQLSFSFEIVSIDGYIQFLVRTPAHFRDLIEGAFYGQFPDAEITEVEDYTTSVPDQYPNDTHDLFGVQFVLSKEDFYPIRTHTLFEKSTLPDDEGNIDPMAGLLEAMSTIGKGEQVWIQYVLTPLGTDWAKGSNKLIAKLIGAPVVVKQNLFDKALDKAHQWGNEAFDTTLGITPLPVDEKKKDEPPSLMMHMTPGQKQVVELIENKVDKMAYKVKMRFLYIGEKDAFSKPRGLAPVMGAIKQWAIGGMNGFKPELKKTSTLKPKYYRVPQRTARIQNIIFDAYKKRSTVVGMKGFLLNVEELASVFHFPGTQVRAPLLKRTDITKAIAPSDLPFEFLDGEGGVDTFTEGEIETVTPTFDYDTDDFEKRFAKDKELYEQVQEAKKDEKSFDELSSSPSDENLSDKVADGGKLLDEEPKRPTIEEAIKERVAPTSDGKNGAQSAKVKAPDNLPFA